MNKIIKLAVSVLIPLLIGAAGSVITSKEIGGWYATLNKPSFNPPNYLFAPVWTTLFVLMGISFYLFWISKGKNKLNGYLVYGLQLFLNFMWSMLFFGLHSPAMALVEIAILWLAIFTNIIIFAKYSKTASVLLVPYLFWVSFASFLNYTVWSLN